MIVAEYPIHELPYPQDASETVGASHTTIKKMVSGRRRVSTTIPGYIGEATLKWDLTEDELRFFLGWWRWILGRGGSIIKFEPTSDFVAETGLTYCILRKNMLKITPKDAGHAVSVGVYVVEGPQ
ncbi:UNVERIFIED_ORG: hypothetical protein GCAPEGMB_00437 [Vibrio phage V07]